MSDRSDLALYARATWRCFEALLEPTTGLPADSIGGDLSERSRSRHTSPTNLAMYIWAALAARDLGLISPGAAERRLRHTLSSLERLERHAPSGQFYNWYDAASGATLGRWPEPPHARVYPFASSVDNGWLASALLMIENALPSLGERAAALARSMRFDSYYDAHAKGEGPGLLRGGFWQEHRAPPGNGALPRGDYAQLGERVIYTGHHYGAFNSEPRIASYLGIALGQIPAEHYFAPFRTFPGGGAWPQKAEPRGEWRTYRGVLVFEGTYGAGDRRVVPSWGGSMFEALMPALVVPEEDWGPDSWGINHRLHVEAQIAFGLEQAGYGFWGFSPAADPDGGYAEYGVPLLGMQPRGYAADAAGLTLCEPGVGEPKAYGQGVVTPHAAFLALDFAPDAALSNLAALRQRFPELYGAGGFKDSVNVGTGCVAERYLALDQGMVMAAIANLLLGNRLQSYLAAVLRPSLEPLMALERFGAGRCALEELAS